VSLIPNECHNLNKSCYCHFVALFPRKWGSRYDIPVNWIAAYILNETNKQLAETQMFAKMGGESFLVGGQNIHSGMDGCVVI
jgi:hypothetical protein